MRPYDKIKNVFVHEGKRFVPYEFADPVFQELWETQWSPTEKLDGTNIRIGLDADNNFFVKGRTDRAMIPVQLYAHCLGLEEGVRSTFDGGPACLYGEGVGRGIQKDGHLYGDRQRLILFDALVGPWWLKRDDVSEVARKIGVTSAIRPTFDLTLQSAVERWMDRGQRSDYHPGIAEGWVLRPSSGLLFRDGIPIRVKLKERDFSQLRDAT